jgi:hypothetical protein
MGFAVEVKAFNEYNFNIDATWNANHWLILLGAGNKIIGQTIP